MPINLINSVTAWLEIASGLSCMTQVSARKNAKTRVSVFWIIAGCLIRISQPFFSITSSFPGNWRCKCRKWLFWRFGQANPGHFGTPIYEKNQSSGRNNNNQKVSISCDLFLSHLLLKIFFTLNKPPFWRSILENRLYLNCYWEYSRKNLLVI